MSRAGRIAARSAGRSTGRWRPSQESAENAGRLSPSRLTPGTGQSIAGNADKGDQAGERLFKTAGKKVVDDFTIHCKRNSLAEKYANNHRFKISYIKKGRNGGHAADRP